MEHYIYISRRLGKIGQRWFQSIPVNFKLFISEDKYDFSNLMLWG